MIRVQIDRYTLCLYSCIRHAQQVYWCVLSPRNTILDEGWQPTLPLARAAAACALFNLTGIRE